MLVSIRIKNLALVEDLSLEFARGFHAITGETGAGKSILIGALNLVVGERADRDWIRSGADACTVEAVFDVGTLEDLPSLLEEFGLEPCQDGQLLLKRVFGGGVNRQFVNGSPATLQALKQIGELLVDIHGPHDHQSLLQTTTQLSILDRFASLEKSRAAFGLALKKVREIEARKRELVLDEKEFQQQLDLLSHQVNEIKAAGLKPDEEARIESDYRVASSAQKLLDLAGRAQEALSEGDQAAVGSLAQAQRALRDLAAIDSAASKLESANANLVEQLQELTRELSIYVSRIDLDPDRLQFLSERMTLIQGLKRKYGRTLPEVIEFGNQAGEKLRRLQGREEELAKLDLELQTAEKQMDQIGLALRAARQKAIPKLTQEIAKQLKELGFLQSVFLVELTADEPSPSGLDQMEFRFAPNPGEPPQPLREIASSGEMARVMLALKTALADQDRVPVLIFDEVDANVGGEIGSRVGEKMRQIGGKHQVLCITHLPQVAALGEHHYEVVKVVEKGRTFTRIEALDAEKRVQELARMLGGKSETALEHARELMKTKGIQNPSSFAKASEDKEVRSQKAEKKTVQKKVATTSA